MQTILVAIVLPLLVTSVGATQIRELDDSEQAALEKYASRQAGRDVWFIEAATNEASGKGRALGLVVFEPASTTEYCLAPTVIFAGELTEGQSWTWDFADSTNTSVQYRFWFEQCDEVDQQDAVVLRKLIEFETLKRVKAEQGLIVESAREQLNEYGSDKSLERTAELREIDIRFDGEHGLVYYIRYSSGQCSGISANVVLGPDRTYVLDAWEIIC